MRACALAAVVFADPEKYAGRVIPVAREAISWPQVADVLTEVTGTKVRRALLAGVGALLHQWCVRLIDAWDEGWLQCASVPTESAPSHENFSVTRK